MGASAWMVLRVLPFFLLDQKLAVNLGQSQVIKDLPCPDHLAKVFQLDDARPPLEADPAIGAVANASAIAEFDAKVVAAVVVDVVVAHKGGLDVSGLEEGGKESRVHVAIVDTLQLTPELVDGLLVLGDGNVEESQGRVRGGEAGIEVLGGLEEPLDLAGLNPVVSSDAINLAVGPGVEEEEVEEGPRSETA